MNVNEPHPLDLVFNIESDQPILEYVEGVDYTSTHSGWLQHLGNQFAKGIKHDKDAEWFKRVIQKRSTFRWWYKGTETKFSARSPGKGWKKGRPKGSLAHGNHNNKGVRNPRAKRYELTYDDGSTIIIHSLRTWCRDNNIIHGTLYHRIQHNDFPYLNIAGVTKL